MARHTITQLNEALELIEQALEWFNVAPIKELEAVEKAIEQNAPIKELEETIEILKDLGAE